MLCGVSDVGNFPLCGSENSITGCQPSGDSCCKTDDVDFCANSVVFAGEAQLETNKHPAPLPPIATKKSAKRSEYYCERNQLRQKVAKGQHKQPKNIRRNNQNHARNNKIAIYDHDSAQVADSSSVHVLYDEELDEIKKKGTFVIQITRPHWEGRKIHWDLVEDGNQMIDLSKPFQQSVIVITTYDQVMHDIQLRFLGSFSGNQPSLRAWVVLCLVHQPDNINGGQANHLKDNVLYNVQETFQQCKKAKYNIVAGKSTSHHQSCGSIHGFGARKEMKIDDIPDSSL